MTYDCGLGVGGGVVGSDGGWDDMFRSHIFMSTITLRIVLLQQSICMTRGVMLM